MGINCIDAASLQRAFLAAARELEARKEWINELNVFPVPDGDTGTNMSLTIMAAAKEVAALENPNMKDLARAISSGSLRGARGNSGVILSQLFRGFTKEIKNVDAIDTTTLANAMVRGTETAYKAVMKPKEGTILTVAKGMADKAMELAAQTDDILEMVEEVIRHGDYVLSQTPEMLPVLKQAGVVDSGGQGLMQVVKGGFDGLTGKVSDFKIPGETADLGPSRTEAVKRSEIDTADIRFGYCTEFIINLEKEFGEGDEQAFKSYLESIGDSLVVVSDDEIVKVHVHTNHPGLAFEKALTFGSLSRMKVDNMREEHEERLIKDAEKLAREQKAQAKEKAAEPDVQTADAGAVRVDIPSQKGMDRVPLVLLALLLFALPLLFTLQKLLEPLPPGERSHHQAASPSSSTLIRLRRSLKYSNWKPWSGSFSVQSWSPKTSISEKSQSLSSSLPNLRGLIAVTSSSGSSAIISSLR